jgi:hypothetical protein
VLAGVAPIAVARPPIAAIAAAAAERVLQSAGVRYGFEGTPIDPARLVYVVQDVTTRAALEALIRVIDPDRPTDMGVTGFSRGGGAGAMGAGSGPASPRKFNVSLTNTTVGESLHAIAKQHGTLSWTIMGVDGWSTGTAVR